MLGIRKEGSLIVWSVVSPTELTLCFDCACFFPIPLPKHATYFLVKTAFEVFTGLPGPASSLLPASSILMIFLYHYQNSRLSSNWGHIECVCPIQWEEAQYLKKRDLALLLFFASSVWCAFFCIFLAITVEILIHGDTFPMTIIGRVGCKELISGLVVGVVISSDWDGSDSAS
ncbi:hypothetical protein NE237_023794 [Protea cynaroides]|uniref:Uncharacterized protein n=1 Tax=Protea cynaroides TaxID=273540 RepID=A0A9Q0HDK6_9MAGN|nr:hypothetical protein NE237_023794 [Protea cynaroides]